MNKVKSALLVTFDFTQRGKSGTGLAAGCLLSACYHHPLYGSHFTVDHLAVRMSTEAATMPTAEDILGYIRDKVELAALDGLVLGCYVWSSALIEPVIRLCRHAGFKGNIILGGYQIMKDSCQALYPGGDIYIPGYAEATLPEAIMTGALSSSLILERPVDFETLPSPYLDGTIQLEQGQEMIHWETRRGCMFNCNFCAHRDLHGNRVKLFGMDKIRQELDLFKAKQVKRINVLDPVFNLEPNHLVILRYARAVGLESLLVFQVRFEHITQEFLALCAGLNVHLEFGLQTAIPEEAKRIRRPNRLTKVEKSICLLHDWKQSFEVGLIYGLPGQTPESFHASIDFLQSRGVSVIKAFPLMLLEGTQLAMEKEKYEIEEDVIDDGGIPHVVASFSFTREQWQHMHHTASLL